MPLQNKKFVFLILSFLFFLNIFAWLAVYDLSQSKFLEVVFFDIGQGDAALIKTAEGHYILIDGGPDSKVLEKLAKELPSWTREIDLIILSHPHDDHFGGLTDVIKGYNVENILWSGIIEESVAFGRWEESVLQSRAKVIIAQAGQKIKGRNFSIDILYPFFNLEGEVFKDANLSSVVLRLVYKDSSFLFTGDSYKPMEKQLIEKEKLCQEEENYQPICLIMTLESDVLKVGHHGSKTSTGEEFIKKVAPEIAVISAGRDNRFGHPHQETLDVLGKYDINILRTDVYGDIRIISDGNNVKFKYQNVVQ